MRTYLLLPVILFLAAAAAVAQPYKIKMDRPLKEGQKFSVITLMQSRQTIVISSGKNPVSQQDSMLTMYMLADGEVLATEPMQIRYEIFQCLKIVGRDTLELVPAGTQVLRTGEKENKEFSIVQGTVSPEAMADLEEVIGAFNGGDADENFGTTKPQLVGGSWKINTRKAVKDFSSRDGMEINEKDMVGTAKLIGLSTMRDIQTYKVLADIEIKKMKIPGLESFDKHNTAAIIKFEGHYPLDENIPIVKANFTMMMDIDGSRKAQDGAPEMTLKGQVFRAQSVEYTYQ